MPVDLFDDALLDASNALELRGYLRELREGTKSDLALIGEAAALFEELQVAKAIPENGDAVPNWLKDARARVGEPPAPQDEPEDEEEAIPAAPAPRVTRRG